MKKRIIQKIVVFSLVLAMQAAPLSYAAEPADGTLQEGTTDVTGETDTTESNDQEGNDPSGGQEGSETETPGETVPGEPEGSGDIVVPGETEGSGTGENPADAENPDAGEDTGDSGEEIPPTPVIPGETGTPGWLRHGNDWYYYDASGAKAYGWRALGGVWYYFDRENTEKPGIMLASGRKVIDGQTYFFGPSGAMRTGWIQEPEGWYYANSSGAMVTGWLLLGNAWYYLDGTNATHPGLMLGNCKEVIGNATYFFGPSGAMRTGWIREKEGWYYGDTTSSTSWKYVNGVWYYLDAANEEYPGLMVEDGKKDIAGATYFFDGNGAMRTGWIQTKEGWYYANGSGAMALGWQWIGGAWYYLDGANATHPGLMLESCKKVIGNATYFFDGNGAMRTGWIEEKEGWYYSDTTSSVGWKYINGAWYYLDAANEEYPGLMAKSCEMNIGGATYSFSETGAMYTGWVQKSEGWYYYNGSGVKVTGWVLGAAWYYLDGADVEYPGRMVTGCMMNIGGINYFFQPSGAMITGWAKRPEGWYYANSSGAMITGWLNLGGKWYYLDASDPEYPGRMLRDCEKQINGQTYVFMPDGAMRAGWIQEENGDWYYYDTNTGQIKSGWQYIGGAWYYLDPNDGNKMLGAGWHEIGGGWYYMYGSGAMATNWLNLGGKWYYLGGDGAMKTGWQYVGNFWYYMYTQNDPHGGEWGVMASNTTIDGYFLQPNGAMMSAEQYNMYLRAQMYGSSTGYLILVDRAACRVGVFNGRAGAWNMVYFWACAPGTAATPTVGGEFTVQGKGYYFDSGSSRCYWYTQFYGNYLFHSVLYSKYTGGLVDGRVGIPLSHGCVRLEINNAKWIYDNIPRGTKVVIY